MTAAQSTWESGVCAAEQSSVLGIMFRQVRDSECFNSEGITLHFTAFNTGFNVL